MAGIIALRFEMQRPERGRYFFAVKALLQDVQVVQENCWWLRFDGAADLMASLSLLIPIAWLMHTYIHWQRGGEEILAEEKWICKVSGHAR